MAEEIASPAQRTLETQFNSVRFLSKTAGGNFSASRGRMSTSESPDETLIADAPSVTIFIWSAQVSLILDLSWSGGHMKTIQLSAVYQRLRRRVHRASSKR